MKTKFKQIKDIELNDEGLLFLNEYEKSLTEILRLSSELGLKKTKKIKSLLTQIKNHLNK